MPKLVASAAAHRLVQCNAKWEHQREALVGDQAALAALQQQQAELAASDLAEKLAAATAARDVAHAAHEQ